jgi:hypothetical protein
MDTAPPDAAAFAAFFNAAGRVLDELRARARAMDPAWQAFFRDAADVLVAAEKRRRAAERITAERFNVFRLIDPDENTLLSRPRGEVTKLARAIPARPNTRRVVRKNPLEISA